jgi:rhodanese-related sulfurtransferase
MFGLFNKNKGYENLTVAQFKEQIASTKDAVILDVRTDAEFRAGAIPKAKKLDFSGGEFGQKVAELDRDKTYFVYCRSGARSAAACSQMARLGFLKVYNLQGGYTSWK